jgi:hypothetical protein
MWVMVEKGEPPKVQSFSWYGACDEARGVWPIAALEIFEAVISASRLKLEMASLSWLPDATREED